MQPALRSPPAFELSAGGDFLWRLLSSLMSAASCAALLAWAASHAAADPELTDMAWVWATAGASGVVLLPLSAWLGWRVSRAQGLGLRWDGQAWWLIEAGGLAEPVVVNLRVAMDLDDWLLLHLAAADPAGQLQGRRRLGSRHRYLRFCRRNAGSNWTLLRAALYTARAAERL